MQNDSIFEAEADLDNTRLPWSNGNTEQTTDPHNQGRDDTIAAVGGYDGALVGRDVNENAPLLRTGFEASDDGNSPDDEASFVDLEFGSLPWYKKPSIIWLLPSFGVLALAYGGTIVPKLNLILQLICRDYMADKAARDPTFTYLPVVFVFGGENPQCQRPEVSAAGARFTLYMQLISGFLSAITSPKLGALSDRYGRRKLIALCSTGMVFNELITIVVAKFPDTFSVNWMLLGFAVDGISGSFTCALALIHSYATDCTKPSKRSTAFGYFHACLFAGIALGPILAAYVIKATGDRVSIFIMALSVHCVFILFTVFILPESLSKSRQRIAREKYSVEQEQYGVAYGIAADWFKHLRVFTNMLQPLRILYPRGLGSSPQLRRNLVLLSAIDTIVFGVAMSMMSVLVLYINMKFGWGDVEGSKFVSVVNIFRVAALLIILPALTWCFRGRRRSQQAETKHGADTLDLYIIRLGVLLDGLGLLGYALAPTGAVFVLSGIVASMGGVASPTLQSALTKHVPPERTGQLLGATGLLHALARVGGPLVFNGLYSLTVRKYAPATFLALSGVFGLAFLGSWFVRPYVVFEEPDIDVHSSQDARAAHRHGD
ncbi:MFS general substrate transporter [Pseudovirgaria hyperparasitica]|uniref:MFS general substrate transporter n=1 Tax=Pseudovirgaria hyperparasitica TaxID=470096 RepID=A0A6A6WMS6_9PEZI|nr:MFS general substrate transporter [Pseudovirgaria hyperparasitica]KAF2763521.1 MFS general substrate transporter [Pseudovirgaria hyperparasitica]